MRKTILTKTAGLIATLMIVSLLTPLIALAGAYFSNLKVASNGNVTGEVYFEERLGDTVTLSVYDKDGKEVGSVTNVTYDVYKNGFYYYNINFNFSVIDSVYKSVYLGYGEYRSELLNRPATPPKQGGTVGGGGGGGGSSVSNGVITLNGNEVSASDLSRAFAQSTHVTIKIKGDFVLLPASALLEAPEGATITIEGDGVSYTLPLSVLNLEELAKSLGVDVKDMKIRIEMKKVTGASADAVAAAVQAAGAKAVANAIDFKVIAEGNNKSIEVTSFGKTYVSRTITLSESVDANNATGVVFNPTTNGLSFVPSTFKEVDGKTVATLKRNSNSIYTVITLDNSFNDVPANHYAADDITLLANKLIVSGVSDSQFDPNRAITRAEFAALVVRSLGLATGTSSTTFSDVSASAWYAPEVAAAVDAGIIVGYEDNTFRPNNTISREELAAMVVRALAYAGKSVELTAAQEAQVLAAFKDADQMTWAKDEVAVAVREGIVYGVSDTSIDAKSTANRAQAVAMLKRYLDNVGFID